MLEMLEMFGSLRLYCQINLHDCENIANFVTGRISAFSLFSKRESSILSI